NVTSTETSQPTTMEVNANIPGTVDSIHTGWPLLQKDYSGFKAAIGFKESQGHYHKINRFGYLGKYQFGVSTLAMIGVHDSEAFLRDPQMQEAAFYAYTSRNKWVLQKDIDRFAGKTIAGVKITESGILAAAHLAGPGGVRKFLRSGGATSSRDAFGTDI